MNNKKICPLYVLTYGEHLIRESEYEFFKEIISCNEKCAWYVNYNDPNKSCCALVDISNVISELPTYLSHN